MKTIKHNRLLSAALICGLTAGIAVFAPTGSAFAQGTTPSTDSAAPKKVNIIFKNGKRVEALLLSETDDKVHVKVTVAGITSETDYRKSDILKIEEIQAPKPETPKTDTPKTEMPGTDASKTETPKAAVPPPADLGGLVEEAGLVWGDQSWRVTSRAVESEPNGPKVYMLFMGGEFGRDVAFTPMKEVIADIKKYEPDVLVYFYDHAFTHYGEEQFDFQNYMGSFDQLETARSIATLMFDEIRNDPSLTKKPRIVSWISKAMGGAAFLPFIAPEIYFAPGGLHGGIGDIEHMFDGVGDERTREKQYSLRQARGEGLVEMGGYDKYIMRAMARTDFVMSYKVVDGNVVLLLDKMPENPDEILLTDDGKETRADGFADVIRGRGNDTLVLTDELAFRLGISKGTAATLDDLMDQMNLPRNYIIIKGKGNQILRGWSKQIADAENQIQRLGRQFREVRVREPGDYQARTRARGEQKQILLRMKSIYERYGESLNPRRVGGKENTLQQIEVALQDLEAAQLADKPERR